MKAAVFKAAGSPLVLEDVPDPTPEASDLILKVGACGICGTDLHMSENSDPGVGWRVLQPGCVMGHEFAGDVIEVGREAQNRWSRGDRVTALPWIGCGECSDCRAGRGFRCAQGKMRASLDLPGAYAEFCRVGAGEAVRLPDSVSFQEGALVEPLAVGLNAVRRAQLRPGDRVLIVGAGPVGLSVALWCRFFGAQHIVVSDLVPARVERSLTLGATAAVDASESNVREQVADAAGGQPRVVFDCVGMPGSLQLAIDSVPRGIRGRLRRHLQILLLGVVLSGCQDLTTSPREFEIPPTPMLADDGLQVSSLAAQGIDPQSIARLAWEIRHGHFEEIHSLVIVRHGHLVFEEYFADDHHIDYQHRLASVTKSVISVVVGTAVQQGFIAGHEQPLHELFPDEIDIFADHPEKRRLLLRHALTMSAGLRWKEGIGGQQGSDSYALDNSFDSMRFALERPIDEAPGEAFAYNDGLTNLLVGAVINSSGLDFEEYAEEHLFGRLGIGNYSWEHQRDGGIRAGGGLHLTNRDLAKIGLLCLQNGVWSGERLLPDDWMELSTRKWIDTHQGHHYGFQWWLQPHAGMPGFLIDSEGGYFGSGYAGQKLFILPEHDLVVASFGSDYELDTDADHAVPHFVLYNILSSLTD